MVEDAELEWVNNSERLGFNKVQSACQNWYNKDKGKGALQVYTGELEGYRKSLICMLFFQKILRQLYIPLNASLYSFDAAPYFTRTSFNNC